MIELFCDNCSHVACNQDVTAVDDKSDKLYRDVANA